MILLDIPAHGQCVEANCTKTVPVTLMLNTMGCIQFKPTEDNWQVLAPRGGVAPYLMRCPEHHSRITHEASLQVGPSGPRMRVKEH